MFLDVFLETTNGFVPLLRRVLCGRACRVKIGICWIHTKIIAACVSQIFTQSRNEHCDVSIINQHKSAKEPPRPSFKNGKLQRRRSTPGAPARLRLLIAPVCRCCALWGEPSNRAGAVEPLAKPMRRQTGSALPGSARRSQRGVEALLRAAAGAGLCSGARSSRRRRALGEVAGRPGADAARRAGAAAAAAALPVCRRAGGRRRRLAARRGERGAVGRPPLGAQRRQRQLGHRRPQLLPRRRLVIVPALLLLLPRPLRRPLLPLVLVVLVPLLLPVLRAPLLLGARAQLRLLKLPQDGGDAVDARALAARRRQGLEELQECAQEGDGLPLPVLAVDVLGVVLGGPPGGGDGRSLVAVGRRGLAREQKDQGTPDPFRCRPGKSTATHLKRRVTSSSEACIAATSGPVLLSRSVSREM